MTASIDTYLHDSMVWEVKRAMREQGICQAELARLAGYSERYTSVLLTGRTPGLLQTWDTLAKALGLAWKVGLTK